jgi:hypothetical protein
MDNCPLNDKPFTYNINNSPLNFSTKSKHEKELIKPTNIKQYYKKSKCLIAPLKFNIPMDNGQTAGECAINILRRNMKNRKRSRE